MMHLTHFYKFNLVFNSMYCEFKKSFAWDEINDEYHKIISWLYLGSGWRLGKSYIFRAPAFLGYKLSTKMLTLSIFRMPWHYLNINIEYNITGNKKFFNIFQ